MCPRSRARVRARVRVRVRGWGRHLLRIICLYCYPFKANFQPLCYVAILEGEGYDGP